MKTGRKVISFLKIKRLSSDGKGKKKNGKNKEIILKPNESKISLEYQDSEKNTQTKEDYNYDLQSDTTQSLSDDNHEKNESFTSDSDHDREKMIQELMMRLNIKMKKTLETMESVHTQELYEITKMFDEAMIREDIEIEKELKKLKHSIASKSNEASRADNPLKYMNKLVEQNALLKLENARLEWKLRRCEKKTVVVNDANRLSANSYEKLQNEINRADACSMVTNLLNEDSTESVFSYSIQESMKYIDESRPIGSVKEVVQELENERKFS